MGFLEAEDAELFLVHYSVHVDPFWNLTACGSIWVQLTVDVDEWSDQASYPLKDHIADLSEESVQRGNACYYLSYPSWPLSAPSGFLCHHLWYTLVHL